MANRIILNETSYFGAGAIREIVPEVRGRGAKKVLVVTDSALMKAQVATKVTQVLDEGGGRNEIASCKYIKYLMPKTIHYNSKTARSHKRVDSGLELSITYDRGPEKQRRKGRQERKTSV